MIVKTHLGNIKGVKGDAGPQGPQGVKGDPFKYEDFTEEQLNELAQKIVPDVLEAANICYVSPAAPTSNVGKDGDIWIVGE